MSQDDDDETVIISNCSKDEHQCDNTTVNTEPLTDDEASIENEFATLKYADDTVYAVFDSGATAHFIVQGAPVINVKIALHPLKIKLPDGTFITSTHTCNLDIPWLPAHMTEAHIVPGLSHASLISTRKFCDGGCKVTFDMDECKVFYQGKLVLSGQRDPVTGLWKVPINPTMHQSQTIQGLDLQPTIQGINHMAANVYTLPFKQQQLKYMHQAFFNPPIPTLIKAINNGHLEGIPFMKADLVRKYLAPSPATSKGRMKRPRTGIRSTRKHTSVEMDSEGEPEQQLQPQNDVNIIPVEVNDESACNVFCYAALADKHDGTMYTDATGALPVLTLDGNQYYFVAYAYDVNYIFALPITNLKDDTILQAFDQVFQELKERGYKPEFNVTDNQAATPIKAYLKNEQTKWQFVEPSNHRVNAAERAIQTFKNHFISGLCSTDRDWPLQLWDQLTEQALITLNLLRTSRIDPTKSAYHQLFGHKYDWNAHPLAPPGTKSVIYEAPESRTSWGNRGLDAWYCGPSLDHYRNSKFYVPSTKAYRTSGSFDLFPQHCILPTFTPEQHATEVYKELFESVQKLSKPAKKKLITKIAKALETIANPQTSEGEPSSEGEPIEYVAPPVTTTNNPTDKRELMTKPRTHQRVTRNNTPGQLPAIINDEHHGDLRRRSKRLNNPNEAPIITIDKPSSDRIPLHTPNLIAFHAVNKITERVYYKEHPIWYPGAFLSSSPNRQWNNYDCDIEHMCAGVTHPVTGETITKYKKLVAMPEFTEVWETAFGKEFGNQAQGDNKTGEKGTNTLFVMDHDQIRNIPKDRTITYGRIVIDYRPQKEDPNRVRITAGGNLIQDYPGEVTTRTADLTTAKIMWNSVISTPDARFMGIDIKSFFITAELDRYEYMKMPLDVVPCHVRDQYDLDRKAKNGYVYLEIRRAIYGLPQSGALASYYAKDLHHTDITKLHIHQVCGDM